MKGARSLTDILAAFDTVSREEWLELIQKDLRGTPVEDMAWEIDGLRISPFTHPNDPKFSPSSVHFSGRWEVAEVFRGMDLSAINADIVDALEGGCETLLVELDAIPNWGILLNGVYLDMINCEFILSESTDYHQAKASLVDYLGEHDLDYADLGIRFHHPIAHPTRIKYTAKDDAPRDLADLIHRADQLRERGITPTFIVEIGNAFYLEVARLRALRLLWQNMQAALGVQKLKQAFLEVHIAAGALSADAHQNMIRSASIALAAVCGGANRLVIRPSGDDSEFHRRIARNIHHLLRMESKFDPLPDPVAGSYYIEAITREMVERGWAILCEEVEGEVR